MIKTHEEYNTTKRALENVEMALVSLKRKVYDTSPERFHLWSEAYIEQISKLHKEMNDYLGITSAEESSTPLSCRLEGRHIGSGNIPITLLSDFLYNFRNGTQRIAQYTTSKTKRDAGRPLKEFSQLFDFRVRILPGSLRIGLSFPVPDKQAKLDMKPEVNIAEESVKKFLEGVCWATGADNRNIEEIFPEREERSLILHQVNNISPTPDGEIKKIEFAGKIIPRNQKLFLVTEHVKKIKDAIYRDLSSENVVEEGESREIDLDTQRFKLRKRPGGKKDIECYYEIELYEEAKKGLDNRVSVIGTLIKPTEGREYIDVEEIQIL